MTTVFRVFFTEGHALEIDQYFRFQDGFPHLFAAAETGGGRRHLQVLPVALILQRIILSPDRRVELAGGNVSQFKLRFGFADEGLEDNHDSDQGGHHQQQHESPLCFPIQLSSLLCPDRGREPDSGDT